MIRYNIEFIDIENEDKIYAFPADVKDHIPKNGDSVEFNDTKYKVVSRSYKYNMSGTYGRLEKITVFIEPKS